MPRRCSHCSNNGHNSRTCPTRGGSNGGGSGGGGGGSVAGGGLRLFGVRLTDGSIIKKSASMGNLSALHYHSSSSAAASPNADSPLSDHVRDPTRIPDGYLSDDPANASCSANRRGERKKGVPWTEEEHRMFLIGLQKLGKGDWRGIARNYVVSRTPTQVASHAQKFFIRQNNATRRKRRSSLFDMVSDDMVTETPSVPEEPVLHTSPLAKEADSSNPIPSLDLSLNSKFEPMEAAAPDLSLNSKFEPMEAAAPEETIKESEESTMASNGMTPMMHGFFPAYIPVPYAYWPTNVAAAAPEEDKEAENFQHQILKPIPMLPKEPVDVDHLVGMSQLSIVETDRRFREPSPLSLKLLGEPSRQSAFHANAPVSNPELSKGKTSPIQAI